MAMGVRARDAAERAIRCNQAFQNSTGSLRGTTGPTRSMGWLSSHPEGAYIRDLLGRAEYVVWSYNTPIGFVSLGDGEVQRFYVDEHHTPTTSQHQSVLKAAWGEYETIGERRPVRRAVVGRPQTASIQELGSRRLGPSLSRDQMDWSAQDDLMDEVSSYTRAHP